MIKLGCVIRVNRPVFQMVKGDQESERLKCPDSGVHKCSAPDAPLWELKWPGDSVCGWVSARLTVSEGGSCSEILQSDGGERSRVAGVSVADGV